MTEKTLIEVALKPFYYGNSNRLKVKIFATYTCEHGLLGELQCYTVKYYKNKNTVKESVTFGKGFTYDEVYNYVLKYFDTVKY